MKRRVTDTQLKEILSSMKICFDTREQDVHVKEELEKKGIVCERRKLDYGDYTFIVPKNKEIGIFDDLYGDDILVFERKKSLDELANNLSNERDRFEYELQRKGNARFVLIVENGSFEDIKKHKYQSLYNPKSYLGTLYSFMARYNMSVVFLKRDEVSEYIYMSCYYLLRELIKKNGL